jgi:hypothetical protein
MRLSGNRTIQVYPRNLRDWCLDVLKQIIVGAVVYFVVASFVNKDKVSPPDTTANVATSLQSR